MQLAATTNPNPHALRVLTKNYRCRIFNCQRSLGASPRTPRGRSLAFRLAPLPRASLTLGFGISFGLRHSLGCSASLRSARLILCVPASDFLSAGTFYSTRRANVVQARPVQNLRELARQPKPIWAKAGGEYRARTGDLLVANQALSQLS
jgi:hypothetical protein